MKGKVFSGIAAGILTLSLLGNVNAASRNEIASIQVKRPSDFKYWTKNSMVEKEIINYVRDVTNKRSKNFIPIDDRIAVFDMDGTILCKTTPSYFEWMLYLHRALYDDDYVPSSMDREYALQVENAINTGAFPSSMEKGQQVSQDSVFADITDEDYRSYVENFMNTPVDGLTNLKWGEAFYLPIVEIIKYLQSNDFTVYIVSGTDRSIIRILACDLLNIKTNNVIGSDIEILAVNQNGEDGLEYVYSAEDYLVRGEASTKNVKMNKVSAIAREIGKQPVIAFGNSTGDTSMLNYTINDNKYKSAAFFVLCDDTSREFGDISKANKLKDLCAENNWNIISMRNDFKTIYGDNVKRSK